MIGLEDMNNLFKLISRNIKKDISCYAFGGNAMMHYGYKNSTKDIDLVFENKEGMDEFIRAIRLLGYDRTSLLKIYPDELLKEKNKPVMYSRGDERFDLFLKDVFETKLNERMKKRVFGKFDFIMKENTLTVFVLGKEDIILMKSITRREKDFDDILTIIEKEKSINWKIIVEEAIRQAKHMDNWVVYGLEEIMQRLKQHTLIKKGYFDMLHKAA